jgi:hypothetical protein
VAGRNGRPIAGAVALAATYRDAAFFRLLPIAWSCSSAPVERRVDTRLWAAPHLAIGEDGPLQYPESIEVSHKARADHGTELLRGQRFSLPSVQDCYDCANRCLDMWNDSVDHASRSSLLRMADAWLQLASEFEGFLCPVSTFGATNP